MSNVINATEQFQARREANLARQAYDGFLDHMKQHQTHEHYLDVMVERALKGFLESSSGPAMMDLAFGYGNDAPSTEYPVSRHTIIYQALAELEGRELEENDAILEIGETYLPEGTEKPGHDVAIAAAGEFQRIVVQEKSVFGVKIPVVGDLLGHFAQEMNDALYVLTSAAHLETDHSLILTYVGRNPKGQMTGVSLKFNQGYLIHCQEQFNNE